MQEVFLFEYNKAAAPAIGNSRFVVYRMEIAFSIALRVLSVDIAL